MPTKIRQGGAWRTITGCKVFKGGSWRSIKAIKVYSDGAWRDVGNFTVGGGDLNLTLSNSSVTRSARLTTIGSTIVIASPTGGQTPYTYAWTKQSGDAISAMTPSNAGTAFQASGMAILETRTAVFRCTVTDTLGSSEHADVSVTITRLEPLDLGGTQ